MSKLDSFAGDPLEVRQIFASQIENYVRVPSILLGQHYCTLEDFAACKASYNKNNVKEPFI